MYATAPERSLQVFKIECADGFRYIVYNASAIGNPADHAANKWYVRPYPVPFPLGEHVGDSYETAEDAEQAAHADHALRVSARK